MSSSVQHSPPPVWKVGLQGARANLVPGLVLQGGALALVLSYYQVPAFRQNLEQLTALRAQMGLAYSALATAFFGGVLPCLYLACQPATRGQYNLRQNLLLIAFWGYKGVEVDFLYWGLSKLVGTGHGLATIFTKMMIDQFVYGPLWAIPTMVLGYSLVQHQLNWSKVWEDVRTPHWYRRRGIPMLVSNLGIWIPAVCIIYSLPTSLQLPLFNLVLCFYTLLLAHLARQAHASDRNESLPRAA